LKCPRCKSEKTEWRLKDTVLFPNASGSYICNDCGMIFGPSGRWFE